MDKESQNLCDKSYQPRKYFQETIARRQRKERKDYHQPYCIHGRNGTPNKNIQTDNYTELDKNHRFDIEKKEQTKQYD